MKDPTVRGVVHLIEETKTFGQKGFRKRLVVLEQSKGTFTNYVPVEFVRTAATRSTSSAWGTRSRSPTA